MINDNNISIPSKKFDKIEREPPKGFNSANDFFESIFFDKEMIWMGQNTNHLHDNTISDAMIKCILSKEYCKYPAPEGFSKLKELILEDLDLKELNVLLTAGATESLYLTMQALIEKEDNVIMSDPGYLIIGNFADRFANQVKYVPIYNKECDYKLTPKLVRENIDEKTKLIVLIDPLNPLGSSYTEEEIKELAEIAIENNIFLLHDVTYCDFAINHTLAAKYAPKNTITIYSFSKIFGLAGLRIGAVVADDSYIQLLKNCVVNDLGVNVVSQAGAIAGLKSKDKWMNYIKETTFNNQKLIKECVDEIDGVFLPVYPSSANMLAIDLSNAGINPKSVAEYLLYKKVFTREGEYTSKNFGQNYLRVSFSIPEEEVKIFCREFKEAIEFLRK